MYVISFYSDDILGGELVTYCMDAQDFARSIYGEGDSYGANILYVHVEA